jgi:hypothetical protein
MQVIINKHNLNSKELSNSPPFKAFIATGACATRGATATATATTITTAITITITAITITTTITTITAAAVAFKLAPQIALT